MNEQGEGAFVIEGSGDDWKIMSYALPKEGNQFGKEELRNTYLAQAMGSPCFEDSEREVLLSYLADKTMEKGSNVIWTINML